MKKNKIIALVVATVCFFAFFEGAFNPNPSNPIWTVVSLVGMLGGTLTALFIGNNESQNQHD